MSARALRKTGHPIGRTLVANLAIIGVGALLLLFALLTVVIQRSFTDLESTRILADQARLEAFKASSLEEIKSRAKDWAIWDETYFYLEDFGPAYEAGNITADSFANLLVDGILVHRYADGANRSFAFSREDGAPLPKVATALATTVARPEFAARMAQGQGFSSFIKLEGQIYALGAIEVTLSDGGGGQTGYLAFVKMLDGASAAAALQAGVRIVPGGGPQGPAVQRAPDHVRITTPFPGVDGKPVGFIDMTLPRPLMAASTNLVLVALAGTTIVIIALLFALQVRMRKLVLRPVENLHAHLQTVRSSGELKAFVGATRDDELGAMQSEFNAMAHELQELRTQLDSQSFALGKSQSAIGLMHNLRNCLSPIRVILDNLERQLGAPLPPQSGRALAELQSPDTPEERRIKLVKFLEAAHDNVGARCADSQHLVREAARHLQNGFGAIDVAQSSKGETRYDERCDLPALLSHSANLARFVEGGVIETQVTAGPDTIVQGNRVLISQVLENLVTNAVESIGKTGGASGILALHAEVDTAAGVCHVSVTDNGSGFDPAEAPSLFERGYSTRAGKGGGLGLHWCANTVRAMGGELAITSAGPNCGATACMTLRLWQDTPAAETVVS